MRPARHMKEENVPLALKLAFAAFFITVIVSFVLELQVGAIDLASPVGAALQFVFWAGIGIFNIKQCWSTTGSGAGCRWYFHPR